MYAQCETGPNVWQIHFPPLHIKTSGTPEAKGAHQILDRNQVQLIDFKFMVDPLYQGYLEIGESGIYV